MKKEKAPDWIIHAIFPEENDMECARNFHTHGLDKYNHPELMIVLALPDEVAGGVLNGMGYAIRSKEATYKEEGIYFDVLEDEYPVRLVKRKMGDDEVMVALLPDENKKLPGDEGCQYPYNKQLEMIEFLKKHYRY